MSSLYALEDNALVLLRNTGSNHKIYRSRMQFCAYRGKGPFISEPEFEQKGFKIMSCRMFSLMFSDESQIRIKPFLVTFGKTGA